ncbi:MAG TPA: outer membrane beta-barrel protein [Chitinophagaceae bacterium]|nr:outer membrane beta-barrel protein [Chitinophagaceae bacterium]
MKKIVLGFLLLNLFLQAGAQEVPVKKKKKDWSKIDFSSKDHLMIQYGSFRWLQKPDSLNTGGFSRSFNMYFLFDFPFKTNPKFSVGLGVGIGSDNLFFKNTAIDLKNRTQILFNKDSVNSYKKYKLTTAYLEAPVELRYTNDPENVNKSFKVALGVKVGTMINAHTKAKVTRDANNEGGYTIKITDRNHFNSLRLAATARIGYGVFSLFGSYQINQLIKDGAGPVDVRPLTIGVTISGL